jgi:outer membrane protein assembly factor BamB
MDGAGPDPFRAAPRLPFRWVAVIILVAFILVSPTMTALGPTQETWPQFRGSDDHVGVSPGTVPTTNETLWDYQLPGEVQGSFAIVDGKALVGCDDGNLYCFDATSGEVLWTFETGNTVYSTPLVSEGRVYLGSADDFGYCLELANGSLIWSVELDSIVSSPALWNDTVYFSDQLGGLWAVDVFTTEVIWNDTYRGELWASPTVVDGRLYLGDILGDFRCYDAMTGEVLWSVQWPGAELYSTPSVADGRVLVGTGALRTLECLDAVTGDPVWTFTPDREVYSSATISEGIVYCHSWERLWALPWDDPDGSGEIEWFEAYWIFETHDTQGGSSPTLAGDRLVVGSDNGHLYCLGMTTGEELWNVSTVGFIYGSPAVAGGRVYFGSTAGRVLCLGRPEVPRLYTTLIPTSTDVTGGLSITIDITVLDGAGDPGGDAFMGYTASDGTLSASFGTVVEGKFRISWTAPDVSSTTTVTIVATGELLGHDIVGDEIVITVAPAEEAPEPDVPAIAHPGLIIGVIAFVILDGLLALAILRGRRSQQGGFY